MWYGVDDFCLGVATADNGLRNLQSDFNFLILEDGSQEEDGFETTHRNNLRDFPIGLLFVFDALLSLNEVSTAHATPFLLVLMLDIRQGRPPLLGVPRFLELEVVFDCMGVEVRLTGLFGLLDFMVTHGFEGRLLLFV